MDLGQLRVREAGSGFEIAQRSTPVILTRSSRSEEMASGLRTASRARSRYRFFVGRLTATIGQQTDCRGQQCRSFTLDWRPSAETGSAEAVGLLQ